MESEKQRRFWGIQEVLKAALKNREFQVWYQPQVHMGTGEIAGAEALVRWRKPGQGLLLPRSFIPELEEYGLMPLLDQEALFRILALPVSVGRRDGSFRGAGNRGFRPDGDPPGSCQDLLRRSPVPALLPDPETVGISGGRQRRREPWRSRWIKNEDGSFFWPC